ncbi:GST-C-6 domain-containing protein [Mycena indigotica]|uniref:GST-C-6 domain-containing protein n=1 Tax=Mycena indigotica TaxID=2126181 RepID=A0A8H6SAJ0_9AGAR|nr:GST-C-6 domain-containing protein [Mycena indigotica]KAF7295402.1 GST-C-6 domain-containing protein [Mycena indigotica]
MDSFKVPGPVAYAFSFFPLHTFPDVLPRSTPNPVSPTLWISPPRSTTRLSADVECLKWQAYLALRGLTNIAIRRDIASEGALDARLPNLHLPDGQLLPARLIPTWAEETLNEPERPLEGYKDQAALDESRAWVSLLECDIHAALASTMTLQLALIHPFQLFSQPRPSYLASLFSFETPPSRPLEAILSPPPPPLFGINSIFPAVGSHIAPADIESKYRAAISALAERLGTDKWLLGSSEPTPLDALAFAYLHTILHTANHIIRIEVTRRVNLVAWELRVRGLVSAAFK